MGTTAKEIQEKLDHILNDLHDLKQRLSDPDIYLTKEEKGLVEQSYINKKKESLFLI